MKTIMRLRRVRTKTICFQVFIGIITKCQQHILKARRKSTKIQKISLLEQQNGNKDDDLEYSYKTEKILLFIN